MDTTVCIPVGPGHDDLAFRALQSAEDQTIKVAVSVVWDQKGRGAGWARNEALKQVRTPYVCFLDADDWLAPEAVDEMEAAIHEGVYIYSDWYQDREYKTAPDCAFCIVDGGNDIHGAHLITALLPTAWAREIGGFDESLPAMEDTAFWLKMRYGAGHEGQRLAQALVHYTPDGARSRQIVRGFDNGRPVYTPLRETIHRQILALYEGTNAMGCCGQPAKANDAPQNSKLPGDVLARALWTGNRRVYGRASGRLYRTGNRQKIWVSPADVAVMPRQFKVVSK